MEYLITRFTGTVASNRNCGSGGINTGHQTRGYPDATVQPLWCHLQVGA